MDAGRYYVALAIITISLSVSYLNPPDSPVSLALSLAAIGLISYFGTELYVYGLRSVKVLVAFVLTAVLAYFNLYAVIPLIAYVITIYLYLKRKPTYSRALLSSTIAAFSFPIAYSISSYNVLMAPLLLLQASGLAVVKETVYPRKRILSVVAYSIPLVILLVLTYGRWLEMLVVALIASWVYRSIGNKVMSYETVLKLLLIFSVATFISYVLPLYVIKISQQAYEYLSVVTGFK